MDINEVVTHPKKRNENSILRRVWKYKFHYIVVLPALFFILILKIIPLIGAFRLPFIDFNIMKGVLGSRWVGMKNILSLSSLKGFNTALLNTITLNSVYILLCAVIALVLALALSEVASKGVRGFFTTILLIPYFIPSIVFSYLLFLIFRHQGSQTAILTNPQYVRAFYIGAQIVKNIGVPVLIALSAINAKNTLLEQANADNVYGINLYYKSRVLPAMKAILAFIIIQFSSILTSDFEMITTLYNPSVYSTMDVLDTFGYRSGFLGFRYSQASSIWFLQYCVQLILTVIAYVLVKNLYFKDLFHAAESKTATITIQSNKRAIFGGAVTAVYTMIVLGMIYMIFVLPFTANGAKSGNITDLLGGMRHNTFFIYMVITFVAVLINSIFTLTLSYPLTVRDLPGHKAYKMIMIAILCAGTSTGTIHEYMYFKSFGVVNTYFPYMISGLFNISSIFVLKSIFNSKYQIGKENASLVGKGEATMFFTLFIPKVWKPLIALAVIQFALVWNTHYTSLLYISKREMMPLIIIFREVMFAGEKLKNSPVDFGSPAVMQLGALITVVPVTLFLIFRGFFTSEALIGQIKK